MIETIHDVGECTSIEELQNQIDNYNQVIAEYKRENPMDHPRMGGEKTKKIP